MDPTFAAVPEKRMRDVPINELGFAFQLFFFKQSISAADNLRILVIECFFHN